MAKQAPSLESATQAAHEGRRPPVLAHGATIFLLIASVFYFATALAMIAVSSGLIAISVLRVYAAFQSLQTSETTLLDAVSALVISVAILDVAKYVMEEEVLRSRELRKPHEAREAVTKFMVIIALVVAIEAIVLVFEMGRSTPELLLFPTFLLCTSVLIVVGLGVFQWVSVHAERRIGEPRDPE